MDFVAKLFDPSYYEATAYRLEADSWVQLPSMKTSRGHHACAVLDNSVYVIGGEYAHTSVERFDLSSLTWSEEQILNPGFVHGPITALVHNSSIYIVNGGPKDEYLNVFKLLVGPEGNILGQEHVGQISIGVEYLLSAFQIGC